MLDKEVILLILIGIVLYLINSKESAAPITRAPTTTAPTTTAPTTTAPTTTPQSLSEEEEMIKSSNLPDNIKNIILEIYRKGKNIPKKDYIPSKEDLASLVDAIKKEVGDTKIFTERINNSSKDKNLMKQISKKDQELFNLMFSLFLISNGVIFSEEITPLLENIQNPNF